MRYIANRESLWKLATFDIGKDKLEIHTIVPVAAKKDVDIGIPELSPSLVRKKSIAVEIAAIDVMTFTANTLPLVENP